MNLNKIMKKFLLAALLILPPFFLSSQNVYAKKLVPQAKRSLVSTSTSGKVGISVKFRSDRRAVNASFTNLSVASKVEYQMTYDTGGITQAATGTIDPKNVGSATSVELIFGTCSGSTCRYDSNIKNAKLTITSALKSGKKYVKTYRLKV